MSTKIHTKNLFNQFSVLCALISMALCLCVRIFSGSPFAAVHRLDPSGIIPPIWILNLFSLVWAFLSGYAAGLAINEVACGRARGAREISAYRGGLFFVVLIFTSLIWYPLFFVGERLFIALLQALSAAICSALCAFFWTKVSPHAALITGANALWSFYIVFVNCSVLIHI